MCADSVEVVLFSIGWDDKDSGGPDVRMIHGMGQRVYHVGCWWVFYMNQLHRVLFSNFILDVEALWVWGKMKERRGKGKGAGVSSPV